MILTSSKYTQRNPNAIKLREVTDFLIAKLLNVILYSVILLNFNLSVHANENIIKQAGIAIENKHYEQANTLFKQLLSSNEFKTQALFGLSKVAFFEEQLDRAENYIAEVMEVSANNPDYLFIAARIAGKQAQSASIFSRLSYANDAKEYFTRALEVNSNHKLSLIGLIKFHQRAPIIAGGDKGEIPKLLNRLRKIDKRAAFSIEAPILLNRGEQEKVFVLYNSALDSNEKTDTSTAQLRFDFAMLLSSKGQHEQALNELLAIEISNDDTSHDKFSMRYYQIGKIAAESNSRLELGLQNMTQYALLPENEKVIPIDWVDFRLAQLKFLLGDTSVNEQVLIKMKGKTSDKDLKKKIEIFWKKNKQ
ncbi:MAG: hypothetical protein L3J46_00980 [Kangiellaceae bacterium]|nr:hypothetical protein [Kangiellaceae bacterium]